MLACTLEARFEWLDRDAVKLKQAFERVCGALGPDGPFFKPALHQLVVFCTVIRIAAYIGDQRASSFKMASCLRSFGCEDQRGRGIAIIGGIAREQFRFHEGANERLEDEVDRYDNFNPVGR